MFSMIKTAAIATTIGAVAVATIYSFQHLALCDGMKCIPSNNVEFCFVKTEDVYEYIPYDSISRKYYSILYLFSPNLTNVIYDKLSEHAIATISDAEAKSKKLVSGQCYSAHTNGFL